MVSDLSIIHESRIWVLKVILEWSPHARLLLTKSEQERRAPTACNESGAASLELVLNRHVGTNDGQVVHRMRRGSACRAQGEPGGDSHSG